MDRKGKELTGGSGKVRGEDAQNCSSMRIETKHGGELPILHYVSHVEGVGGKEKIIILDQSALEIGICRRCSCYSLVQKWDERMKAMKGSGCMVTGQAYPACQD